MELEVNEIDFNVNYLFYMFEIGYEVSSKYIILLLKLVGLGDHSKMTSTKFELILTHPSVTLLTYSKPYTVLVSKEDLNHFSI